MGMENGYSAASSGGLAALSSRSSFRFENRRRAAHYALGAPMTPMNGKPKRLYVSDLDGTLLDARAKLSVFTRTALGRLLESGVDFTVATARSVQAVRSILGDLPLRLPIVEQNGACVTDLVSGRHLLVNELLSAVGGRVLDAFRGAGAEAIVACIDGGVDCVVFEAPRNVGTAWYIEEKRLAADPRLRPTHHVASAIGAAQLLSVTTLAPEAIARPLFAALSQELAGLVQLRLAHHLYVPGWWELSVLDARATKASSIAWLRSALGSVDAELVVFGDGENDIDMFRAADVSVAVANSAAELLALATHVAGDHRDDGVARWLLGQHDAA